MPICRDCKWRNGKDCRAHSIALQELKRDLPPPPTGACTVAIVEGYLSQIKTGMRVLEIGCGTWTKIYDHCQRVGAFYEGIDVQSEYYGIKCIATRLENLASLSYPDSEFDLVIGNQTMEHWGEHGCAPIWGLYQCFRVLKPNGKLLMNVPIHFHGTKDFVHGRIGHILNMFSRFSSTVKLEEWGKVSDPIAPYFPHPKFAALECKAAYVLDIQAVKDKVLPRDVTNKFGFNGKIAQLFHYSFAYNWYRFKSKVFNG